MRIFVSDTFFLVALGIATNAHAGRPLSTEDASVLEGERCQVEAWVDRGHDATRAWLAPACNFGAGIEWQAGFARSREEGRSRHSEAYVQGKALIRALGGDSPWGVGLVAGVTRRPLQTSHRGWHDPYVIVPISVAVGEGLVHFAPGWAHSRAQSRNATLWGLAYEAPASGRFTLLAEAFGENGERPFIRAGARMQLVKDVADLDLTVVTRPGGTRDERYVSFGIFWQSGRLPR